MYFDFRSNLVVERRQDPGSGVPGYDRQNPRLGRAIKASVVSVILPPDQGSMTTPFDFGAKLKRKWPGSRLRLGYKIQVIIDIPSQIFDIWDQCRMLKVVSVRAGRCGAGCRQTRFSGSRSRQSRMCRGGYGVRPSRLSLTFGNSDLI